jgi:transcription antitermination factor NusB
VNVKKKPNLDTPPQIKRHAREMVLKVLYEVELAGLDGTEARAVLTRRIRRAEERDFALALLEQTLENLERIDRMISGVAENWDLSRMAVVDRNILRIGAAEIIFGKVPASVAINEAIEIAKKFSTEDSGRFVNGILDKVARLTS